MKNTKKILARKHIYLLLLSGCLILCMIPKTSYAEIVKQKNNSIYAKISIPIFVHSEEITDYTKPEMEDKHKTFENQSTFLTVTIPNAKVVYNDLVFSGRHSAYNEDFYFIGKFSEDKSTITEFTVWYSYNLPKSTNETQAIFTLKNLDVLYNSMGNQYIASYNKEYSEVEVEMYKRVEGQSSSNWKTIRTTQFTSINEERLGRFKPQLRITILKESLPEGEVKIVSTMIDFALQSMVFHIPAYDSDEAFEITADQIWDIIGNDPDNGAARWDTLKKIMDELEYWHGAHIKSHNIAEDMALVSHEIIQTITAPLEGKGKELCDYIKEIVKNNNE